MINLVTLSEQRDGKKRARRFNIQLQKKQQKEDHYVGKDLLLVLEGMVNNIC